MDLVARSGDFKIGPEKTPELIPFTELELQEMAAESPDGFIIVDDYLPDRSAEIEALDQLDSLLSDVIAALKVYLVDTEPAKGRRRDYFREELLGFCLVAMECLLDIPVQRTNTRIKANQRHPIHAVLNTLLTGLHPV